MRRVNVLRLEPADWTHGRRREGYRSRSMPVGSLLGAERIGGTLYALDEGQRASPYHFHYGMEEWLIVIEGTPTLRAYGGERRLRAGDVVCFPAGPDGAHQVRGAGVVLMLSANRSPEVVEYLDSGKIGARPPGKLFRAPDAVDYWEGE